MKTTFSEFSKSTLVIFSIFCPVKRIFNYKIFSQKNPSFENSKKRKFGKKRKMRKKNFFQFLLNRAHFQIVILENYSK